MEINMKDDFYVYIFFDPFSNQPFYVGKGKGGRYKQHEKEIDKQLEYFSLPSKSPEKLLSLKLKAFYDLREKNVSAKIELIENLNESDAFLLEHSLIAWFGRRLCGNGVLTNILSGGNDGELLFDDQLLINVYNRPDLLNIILRYPRLSSNWVAKSLYFFNKNSTGYPFEELSIYWLNTKINFEQYAVEVIEKLKEYDSVITPFYWVRKIKHQRLKTDNTIIFRDGFELIKGTYWEDDALEKMEINIRAFNEIVDKV